MFKHFSPFLLPRLPRRRSSPQVRQKEEGGKDDIVVVVDDDDASEQGNTKTTTTVVNRRDIAIWSTLSARLGSISDNKAGGWYAYRASKAALNSLIKSFDLFLQLSSSSSLSSSTAATTTATTEGIGGSPGKINHGGVMAVGLHPGTVRTDLTNWFLDSHHPPPPSSNHSKEDRPLNKDNNNKKQKNNKDKDAKEKIILQPDQAVAHLHHVLSNMNLVDHRGRCWDWKGVEILP